MAYGNYSLEKKKRKERKKVNKKGRLGQARWKIWEELYT